MGGAISSYKLKKLLKNEKARAQKAKEQEAKNYIQRLYNRRVRNERIQETVAMLDDPSNWRYEQIFCSKRDELEAEREQNTWSDLLQVRLQEREQSDWWDALRHDLEFSLWDKPRKTKY